MSEAKHLRLPYSSSPTSDNWIIGADGHPIGQLYGETTWAKERAAFVIHACNSHDALLARFTELAASMRLQRDNVDPYCCKPICDEVIEACEAAIAEAHK